MMGFKTSSIDLICRISTSLDFTASGSWISDENRRAIVEFLRRKLKVGGVCYISYNALPGCASFFPVRELLIGHAESMGVQGRGIVSRFDEALAFFDRVLEAQPHFAAANPHAFATFNQLKAQSRNYGVHEYFNRNWLPMNFSTLADWLKPAKLSFAASAAPIDQLDGVVLNENQTALMRDIPDPILRQNVYDFIHNRRFRLDYWIKGSRTLSLPEQEEKLRALTILLVTPRADIPLTVATYGGEAALNEPIFAPLLDLLADHAPKSLGELESALKGQGLILSTIVQSAIILMSGGHICLVQDEAISAAARARTERLNTTLIHQSLSNADLSVLASPVSGGGVRIQQFQQMFLLALRDGRKLPQEWAEFVFQRMTAQGRQFVLNGKTLETEDEGRQALLDDATTFADKQLPILKALQVV